MAGWLSRATEQFRGKKPPPPEPYDVQCDCGARVVGNRAATAQRPACPSCSRPVFVLPQNVYPIPVKRPRADQRPIPNSQGKSSNPVKGAKHSTEKSVRNQEVVEVVDEPKGVKDQAPFVLVTPFRLVAAAILLIAGLTGWILWHRTQVAAAKSIVLSAKEAGLKALEEGDFIVAARELKRARDAVDLLDRKDPEAELIRRACNEAVAGNDLNLNGYFDFLTSIVSGDGKSSPRLEGRSRTRWLLYDSVVLLPETSSKPCILDCPVEVGSKKLRVEITSAQIRKAIERSGDGTQGRVIFAAQPLRVSVDPQDSSTLVLTLNDQSAFLWTKFETYEFLGYREGSPQELQMTRDLLTHQLQQLEESP